MRQTFDSFPEIVLVDATHNTNNLRMPIYVFLVIDGNGQSEIVASFVVLNEQAPLLRKMITVFKDRNPKWVKIQVILTDKDMNERYVFREQCPNADLQICLFHVLRTMRREITTQNMGISSGERNSILELVQKMMYSRSNPISTTVRL